MITISLCMIVKNEKNYIENCLRSISDLVDEIIIVDTGSTDNTKEICEKYTSKIYDFKWINDFSAARNFSFSKATKDYIMWLDADDILLEEDREKLKELKKSLPKEQRAVSMIYDYAFDENGKITLSFRRNRLIKNKKRSNYNYWVGFVHEIINVSITDSFSSDIHVTHTKKHSSGTRNLDLFEAKAKEGVKFNTRNTLYYAKELFYNNINDRAIELFDEFLSKKDAWVEDVIDALIKVSDIYKRRGDIEAERKYLYKTFDYAIRAEALYPLGVTFYSEGKYLQALFFFESILNLEFPVNCNGWLRNDEWNIRPLVQASCCCYYLGEFNKGKMYHLKAKELSPNDEYVIYNDKFFRVVTETN